MLEFLKSLDFVYLLQAKPALKAEVTFSDNEMTVSGTLRVLRILMHFQKVLHMLPGSIVI